VICIDLPLSKNPLPIILPDSLSAICKTSLPDLKEFVNHSNAFPNNSILDLDKEIVSESFGV